jgi:hypothetical protein
MELDGDISLYHPGTGRAVVLNGTASDVWRLLDGRHTVEQVVDVLAGAYRTEPAAIRPDVERVIAELAGHGFLAS